MFPQVYNATGDFWLLLLEGFHSACLTVRYSFHPNFHKAAQSDSFTMWWLLCSNPLVASFNNLEALYDLASLTCPQHHLVWLHLQLLTPSFSLFQPLWPPCSTNIQVYFLNCCSLITAPSVMIMAPSFNLFSKVQWSMSPTWLSHT